MFLDECKKALDAWGNYVQSLLSGINRDNVVNLSVIKTEEAKR